MVFFDIVAQVRCRRWQQPGLERLVVFVEGAHLHEGEQREKTRTLAIASDCLTLMKKKNVKQQESPLLGAVAFHIFKIAFFS